MITDNPSVDAPFRVYTSLANREVKIPGALSLRSNQPIFFVSKERYRLDLMFFVIFSPMTPKRDLPTDIEIKLTIAQTNIPKAQ